MGCTNVTGSFGYLQEEWEKIPFKKTDRKSTENQECCNKDK